MGPVFVPARACAVVCDSMRNESNYRDGGALIFGVLVASPLIVYRRERVFPRLCLCRFCQSSVRDEQTKTAVSPSALRTKRSATDEPWRVMCPRVIHVYSVQLTTVVRRTTNVINQAY